MKRKRSEEERKEEGKETKQRSESRGVYGLFPDEESRVNGEPEVDSVCQSVNDLFVVNLLLNSVFMLELPSYLVMRHALMPSSGQYPIS